MASVYHFLDDALHVAEDIVKNYEQQDQDLLKKHQAATLIQRTFRRYIAHNKYMNQMQATIVLQKYCRGWLVRCHLSKILKEFYDSLCQKQYNMAANKIQAAWKGKQVRKQYDITEVMKEKRKTIEESQALMKPGNFGYELSDTDSLKQSITNNKNSDKDLNYNNDVDETEDNLKTRILELMFDRHHLVSTEIRKGVLHCNEELKEIEKLLKTLPWKDFMKKRKKLYYKYLDMINQDQNHYIFQDKKMRKQEDLYRLRNKSNDLKRDSLEKIDVHPRKSFILNSKLSKQSYQRDLLLQGPYARREINITRTEDKSKNICDKDFILALRNVAKDCNIPPYYPNFWYEQCIGHYFTE
ncbi:hypothetical protein ABEB36_000764 [Hypothenemus hampei]|uniref:Spermatogenesis-associated protein 17 n=1 Tax=Hypothenemus hampei TaxID=57062 RepID=A0ABD1FD51_HYPHA